MNSKTFSVCSTRETQAVIDAILSAFPTDKLNNGMTVHEADREGVIDNNTERNELRTIDSGKRWTDIPAETIEYYSFALSNLDKEGWLFYLPAYMRWAVINGDASTSPTLDFVLSSLAMQHSDDRFNALSNQQCKAVLGFLHYVDRYNIGGLAPEATVAVNSWLNFEAAGKIDQK